MQTVCDDANLRIVHQPGTNRKLIVAFAGIGHNYGGIQVEEFRRSLRAVDETNHIAYVIDKQRSWYNLCFEEVLIKIDALTRETEVTEVYTLGNSMGGFGALLYGSLIENCIRTIAFSAQSSVHPEFAPFENRWSDWTGAITHWRAPDLLPYVGSGSEKVTIFGSNSKDVRHAERLRGIDRVHIAYLADAGHNVAAVLRERGALVPLLSGLLEPGVDVPALLAVSGLTRASA